MFKLMVCGSGTNVGKTIAAAILATLFKGNYWKPIECGEKEESDSFTMQRLICHRSHTIYPPTYSFKAPLSPHHAARLEKVQIETHAFKLPLSDHPLIIEGVGGVLVPITTKKLTIDLFQQWDCQWIVVCKHYLGSINHTLLTLEALKQRAIRVIGLIFNGTFNPDSEQAILEASQLPMLARINQEKYICPQIIQKYAKQWLPLLHPLISYAN